VAERQGAVERVTGETSVKALLRLAPGESEVRTGVGFLDHMLLTLARHAVLCLRVEGWGDLHVDAHHTVEDVGLALGECLHEALGERAGIARFGFAYAPLDEALARAVVDVSGRPFARVAVPPELANAWVTREFPLTLAGEFWRALASRARLTLHLDLERGVDPHHAAEAMFKAASLALRQAVAVTGTEIPSTKGTLSA
jgi:imidazoleglycerol-phosphate dehydratase